MSNNSVAPDQSDDDDDRDRQEPKPSRTPHCEEVVNEDAAYCPYCGYRFWANESAGLKALRCLKCGMCCGHEIVTVAYHRTFTLHHYRMPRPSSN